MKTKIAFTTIALAILSILLSVSLFAKKGKEKEEPHIVKITATSFDKETEKGIVVVDFWAPWCGPCRQMNPILEELSIEFQNSVKIGKLNVDQNSDFAHKKNVRAIPLIIILKNGKEATRVTGAVSKEELRKTIIEVVNSK